MKRFLLLLFLPSFMWAETPPCAIQTAQDVLSCVLKQHPDILRGEAELRSAAALEQAAGQRPNPEVDSEVTSFSDSDQPATKIEAAYLHTFELGRKRSRRIGQALTKRQVAEARLQRTRETVLQQTVLSLYRLRQLNVETGINVETVEAFRKITRSYQSRARLSPEQEISLNVFSLAHTDAQLRHASLLQERISLETFFKIALGTAWSGQRSALPPETMEWLSVVSSANLQGATRKEAQASLALSESGLALAQSGVWPDMRLGPRLETESGHGQSNQGFGAAFSLGLPLYHRNLGERRVAQAEVEQAQVNLVQLERELSLERSKWLSIYETATAAYRAAPVLADMEQRHQKVENQFQRGLVSASLVIEAHRQMAEYAKSRHEQELKALEALWALYVLEGRAFEVKL